MLNLTQVEVELKVDLELDNQNIKMWKIWKRWKYWIIWKIWWKFWKLGKLGTSWGWAVPSSRELKLASVWDYSGWDKMW